jgi:hypothetical protein
MITDGAGPAKGHVWHGVSVARPAQGPTSFGGVLAMMLAVLPPAAVAGIILNDIDDAYR